MNIIINSVIFLPTSTGVNLVKIFPSVLELESIGSWCPLGAVIVTLQIEESEGLSMVIVAVLFTWHIFKPSSLVMIWSGLKILQVNGEPIKTRFIKYVNFYTFQSSININF